MNNPRYLGIVGSIVLFLGTFAPIVSMPIIGSLNYFSNAKGDGILLVALAASALVLVVVRKCKWLAVPGILSICILLFTLFTFLTRMRSLEQDLPDSSSKIFSGLGKGLVGTIQIQWGWGILFVGAGILIAASIADFRETASRPKLLSEIFKEYKPLAIGVFVFLLLAILAGAGYYAYRNRPSEQDVVNLIKNSEEYQEMYSYSDYDFGLSLRLVSFPSDQARLNLSKATGEFLMLLNKYPSIIEKYAFVKYLNDLKGGGGLSLVMEGLVEVTLKPTTKNEIYRVYEIKTAISDEGRQKGCIVNTSSYDMDSVSVRCPDIIVEIIQLRCEGNFLERTFGTQRHYLTTIKRTDNNLYSRPDLKRYDDRQFRADINKDVLGQWHLNKLTRIRYQGN